MPTVSIDFSRRWETPKETQAPENSRVLQVAVAGMISPAETSRLYQELLDHIGGRLGFQTRLRQRKTYQEVNDLLAKGELDVAFLCSGGYVYGGKALGAEILAIPAINSKTTYQAYIIVQRDSSIRHLAGLRHHSFAFTDPMSNTGWLYPVSRLTDLGTTPSSFFSRISYTYGHDLAIQAVAQKVVDGASVDSLVYDYLARTSPEKVRDIRIVERSPEFAIPPLVASSRLDPTVKAKLKAVLIGMHDDAGGSRILRKLSIDRFVEGDERAYESVRRMARKVGPWRP